MTLRVSGKNMDVGDALRGKGGGALSIPLSEKYFDGGYNGHLTLDSRRAPASAPTALCTSIRAPCCRPAPTAAIRFRPMR